VSGCHEGDCHYLAGNIQARKRVARVKKVLAEIGWEPERLEMFHVASSEGPKFARVATEMTERALKLGPNPVKREARLAWENAHRRGGRRRSEATPVGWAPQDSISRKTIMERIR
jgi:hypothetical protein